jgi:crotonobetainyl-CoA:carnitine CoA-transferase CaiB-like acyl-CoA transferase
VLAQPQVAAREMLLTLEHPTIGELRMVGFPIKLSRTPASVRYPPPLHGQHSAEVLAEVGLTPADLHASNHERCD